MNQGFYIVKENLKIDDLYLRRPISICDYNEQEIVIIYKVIGSGTKKMALKQCGDILDCLVGLGNGFQLKNIRGNQILLIGGGVGIPPLYNLTKKLLAKNFQVQVVLGFNCSKEAFYIEEFKKLTDNVHITTIDGSIGFCNNAIEFVSQNTFKYDFYCICGPEKMLKAMTEITEKSGLLSFEARMGCGFGACMGCSCQTVTGAKRICVEGPVLKSEEVVFNEG